MLKTPMERNMQKKRNHKSWQNDDFSENKELKGLLDLSPGWFALAHDVGINQSTQSFLTLSNDSDLVLSRTMNKIF